MKNWEIDGVFEAEQHSFAFLQLEPSAIAPDTCVHVDNVPTTYMIIIIIHVRIIIRIHGRTCIIIIIIIPSTCACAHSAMRRAAP